MADGEVVGCAREPVVEGDVQVGRGDLLDDDVVGAGDEDLAAPARALGRGDAGGEVDAAAVGARFPVRRPQPYVEGRVERLDPLEGAAVGEGLGRGHLSGEQPVLEGGEFGGEFRRAGAFAAVRADEGVVRDDDPLVVRIAEHHGAVVAVAAQEGVLPAGGGPRLPGAVDGTGAHGFSFHGFSFHGFSTATP